MSAHSAAVLNIAPDHVDWHGSMEAYTQDKGRIYENCQVACVYNVADPATEHLVEEADVIEGCRAIGFTLGTPGLSMLGLVDDLLVDRAFVEQRATSALELASLSDITPPAPHNVANALAAAALARAFGVPATAIRDGLRGFRPDEHRIAHVAEVAGVNYVDDSKATNPHAAQASLLAYEHVVWIAGGQAKGATFDELVIAATHAVARRRTARAGQGSDRRSTCSDTHRMSRGSSSSQRTLEPWRPWWGRQRSSHRWGTPCCSRLAAHPGTCSPTTEPAETPSPKPYCAGRPAGVIA